MQHVCESEDREEVVVCELCECNVVSFNQHMKRNHPGCGRSANRQGYRSNGSYVDGWFGGECGSGNPYYLLCGSCREKYLALKTKTKTTNSERYLDIVLYTPASLNENNSFCKDIGCLFGVPLHCKELVSTELGAELIEVKEFHLQQILELFLVLGLQA